MLESLPAKARSRFPSQFASVLVLSKAIALNLSRRIGELLSAVRALREIHSPNMQAPWGPSRMARKKSTPGCVACATNEDGHRYQHPVRAVVRRASCVDGL